jgi:hypothetical protein
VIAVEVPVRTVSESNARGHWSKRAGRAKAQRGLVALMLRARAKAPKLRPIVGGLVVTLTRIAPRALDDDNLRGALKACRDGVADWLGVDDRDRRVEWRYAQKRGAAKAYAVVLEVTEARDGVARARRGEAS